MKALSHSALILAGLFASCATSAVAADTVASSVPPAVAPVAFDPQAVFAMPEREDIDKECTDARSFAEMASAHAATIGPDDAFAAGKAFLACNALARANGNRGQARYLGLSAAAALYLAATKVSGDDARRLFEAADTIAAQLGDRTPDRSLAYVEVIGSTVEPNGFIHSLPVLNDGRISAPGPAHTTYDLQRDPLRTPGPAKFGDLVDELRASVAGQLASFAIKPNTPAQAAAAPVVAPKTAP